MIVMLVTARVGPERVAALAAAPLGVTAGVLAALLLVLLACCGAGPRVGGLFYDTINDVVRMAGLVKSKVISSDVPHRAPSQILLACAHQYQTAARAESRWQWQASPNAYRAWASDHLCTAGLRGKQKAYALAKQEARFFDLTQTKQSSLCKDNCK
jgi:hypothetical protein